MTLITKFCLSFSDGDVEKKRTKVVLSLYELGIITLIFILVILV